MKDPRTVEELTRLISHTGSQILTACEDCNSTYQEADLGQKICTTLNFKTTDLLYFSFIQIKTIIASNHDRECLRLRMLINGYLEEVFNFFSQ